MTAAIATIADGSSTLSFGSKMNLSLRSRLLTCYSCVVMLLSWMLVSICFPKQVLIIRYDKWIRST